MQPAFLSLFMIAVHVCVRVDCKPRLQDPRQLLQQQHSSLNTGAGTSAATGRFYLELRGSMRRGIHHDSLVILPVRAGTSNFVSIFDLRRKRFLCMDVRGQLYISRHKDRGDCLFQHIWLDLVNHNYVFYSTSGGQMLRLSGSELQAVDQEQPEPTSPHLLKSFLGPLVKRQRRSERVNPSDPLRSESRPSHSIKHHKDVTHRQPEQDQAGAVSKETITSCDDPLRVLQSNGPQSPVKTNIADRAQQN